MRHASSPRRLAAAGVFIIVIISGCAGAGETDVLDPAGTGGSATGGTSAPGGAGGDTGQGGTIATAGTTGTGGQVTPVRAAAAPPEVPAPDAAARRAPRGTRRHDGRGHRRTRRHDGGGRRGLHRRVRRQHHDQQRGRHRRESLLEVLGPDLARERGQVGIRPVQRGRDLQLAHAQRDLRLHADQQHHLQGAHVHLG